MAAKTKSVQLRDILYELSLAKPIPDSEVLDDFIRRFPEHAAALTDFAIELALDGITDTADRAISPEEIANKVSPVVSRAMSRFQNQLFAFQTSKSDDQREAMAGDAIENPFAKLSKPDFRALAIRLNANSVFLLKLRDRQIDPTTMTVGFQRRVAEELNIPPEVIMAHSSAQQQVPAHQRFKADQNRKRPPGRPLRKQSKAAGLHWSSNSTC